MSGSTKNNIKNSKSKKDVNVFILRMEEKIESLEKPKNYLSLKNAFYDIDKDPNNLIILNYITNSNEKKYSAKTNITSTAPEKLEYDISMINKYDENFYASLSFISEFDLEADPDDKENDSFSSSDNDSYVEEIEIKSDKKIIDKKYYIHKVSKY